MTRKARKYPSYRTLLKHGSSKIMLENKLCLLCFVPNRDFRMGGFRLTKRSFWDDHDKFCAFPNTKDGYYQALAECESWINSQLDKIEEEFYER